MSRWAEDPERSADALIERALDGTDLRGRILLVNQSGRLPGLLAARGLDVYVWNRRLTGTFPAMPWPAGGPYDAALVRLAKAKDEQEMTAHAVLSVLSSGCRFVLYGGNDEGIRSASAMLMRLAGTVETLDTRGHGRVLSARREPASPLKDSLRAWRTVSTIELAGMRRDWIAYPGVFAAGRLDEGTALLLEALLPLAPEARVLDYGCGSGVIGAAVLARQPNVVLHMIDSDAVAVEAARENVPSARHAVGMRLADAGQPAYQVILSNPPLHQGIAEDRAALQRLIADAPAYLAAGGILQIVVQRRLALDRLFARHFADAGVVAENGRYRVWRAQRA
jgi:16S rRNA (guanine1207-N2)-methyltransferase